MNIDEPQPIDLFLDLSVELTGFPKFNLQGTGQASQYFKTVEDIIGIERFVRLMQTFHDLQMNAGKDPSAFTKGLRSEIFGSEEFGAIARNIIKLWYVATWYQLPASWRDTFGANEQDRDFIVSPEAYPEGLLWQTLGVNPPGAKAPGYGTWSNPPTVTLK